MSYKFSILVNWLVVNTKIVNFLQLFFDRGFNMVERIKELCKKNNTTMGTLEKEMGLGNGTIRRWDERMPGADRALALANRLGVTVEYLLTGKEAADLTPEEQLLVDYYRTTNPTGRAATLATARTNSELMPKEAQSSDSKIG